MHLYIPGRRSYRTLGTARMYPSHTKVLIFSRTQTLQHAEERLIAALKNTQPVTPLAHTHRHLDALKG